PEGCRAGGTAAPWRPTPGPAPTPTPGPVPGAARGPGRPAPHRPTATPSRTPTQKPARGRQRRAGSSPRHPLGGQRTGTRRPAQEHVHHGQGDAGQPTGSVPRRVGAYVPALVQAGGDTGSVSGTPDQHHILVNAVQTLQNLPGTPQHQ